MSSDRFELRDRRGGFLWVSNKLFDSYAAELQPTSFMVYLALCRLANNDTQECYPSQARIAEMIGVSDRTVRECLSELAGCGLIAVEAISGRKNRYYLVDTPEKSSGVKGGSGLPVTPEKNSSNPGSTLPTNKTYNKTKEQDLLLDSEKTESSEQFSLSSDDRRKKQKADPRHALFKQKFIIFWNHINQPMTLYWEAADAKKLSEFLTRNPSMSVDQFKAALLNYRDSEGIIKTKLPRQLLPYLNMYFDGPLDKYNKPMSEEISA